MEDEIKLPIDVSHLSNAEYKALWQKLGKIEIKMVEKLGECRHNVGERYIYETPYKKPQDVCTALLHVLDAYTWRVILGFPSWEAEDRNVYWIHCPSRGGTVWEMRRIKE